MKTAFAYFDKDNSGSISKEELKDCLKSDDFTLQDDEIDKLLSGVDQDGDGQIDYVEFIAMMKDSMAMWEYQNKKDGRGELSTSITESYSALDSFITRYEQKRPLVSSKKRAPESDSISTIGLTIDFCD